MVAEELPASLPAAAVDPRSGPCPCLQAPPVQVHFREGDGNAAEEPLSRQRGTATRLRITRNLPSFAMASDT